MRLVRIFTLCFLLFTCALPASATITKETPGGGELLFFENVSTDKREVVLLIHGKHTNHVYTDRIRTPKILDSLASGVIPWQAFQDRNFRPQDKSLMESGLASRKTLPLVVSVLPPAHRNGSNIYLRDNNDVWFHNEALPVIRRQAAPDAKIHAYGLCAGAWSLGYQVLKYPDLFRTVVLADGDFMHQGRFPVRDRLAKDLPAVLAANPNLRVIHILFESTLADYKAANQYVAARLDGTTQYQSILLPGRHTYQAFERALFYAMLRPDFSK